MKLDELRRQFQNSLVKPDAPPAHKRTKILERCYCGHLAEERAGPDERIFSARRSESTPPLAIGFCHHCSCTRHNPVSYSEDGHLIPSSREFETLPLPPFKVEKSDWDPREATRKFSKEYMGEWAEETSRIPFPELLGKDGTSMVPPLDTYALLVPEGRLNHSLDWELVQIKAYTTGLGARIGFSVWNGSRGRDGWPKIFGVRAENLFSIEAKACECRASFPSCRVCNGLGQIIGDKAARMIPVDKA